MRKFICIGLIIFLTLTGNSKVSGDTSRVERSNDSTVALKQNTVGKLSLPDIQTRISILIIAVVLLGGLGLLFNMKRKRLDEDVGL